MFSEWKRLSSKFRLSYSHFECDCVIICGCEIISDYRYEKIVQFVLTEDKSEYLWIFASWFMGKFSPIPWHVLPLNYFSQWRIRSSGWIWGGVITGLHIIIIASHNKTMYRADNHSFITIWTSHLAINNTIHSFLSQGKAVYATKKSISPSHSEAFKIFME